MSAFCQKYERASRMYETVSSDQTDQISTRLHWFAFLINFCSQAYPLSRLMAFNQRFPFHHKTIIGFYLVTPNTVIL